MILFYYVPGVTEFLPDLDNEQNFVGDPELVRGKHWLTTALVLLCVFNELEQKKSIIYQELVTRSGTYLRSKVNFRTRPSEIISFFD